MLVMVGGFCCKCLSTHSDTMINWTPGVKLYFLLLLTGLVLTNTCPDYCVCNIQGAVKCKGEITEVPAPMPVNTYLLLLEETRITVLNSRSLLNLPLMLRFSMSRGLLQGIHPEAFKAVPQLLSLKLSFNKLENLSMDIFSKQVSLEQLHLDNNKLYSLHPSLFNFLTNLTELDVSKNFLTYLDSDIFQKLTNLRYLNLGSNLLNILPANLFNPLTRLQFLMLYNNQLETLKAGIFDNLTNLLVLKLFNNKIEQIDQQVFWHLSNLEMLSISSNKLQYFAQETFYFLPKMTKFNFYKNPLVHLPKHLIGYMPKLKEFYLYSTNLVTVPENIFKNMSQLEKLSLSVNSNLSYLPRDIFWDLPKLQNLSLQLNNVEFLPSDIFSKLPNMKTLILHSNKLRSLQGTIFSNLPKLTQLELHGNRLEILPDGIFSGVNALNNVTLKDNPWNCTCNISALAAWIHRNTHVVSDFKDVVCHSPPYLQNKTVASLNSELSPCYDILHKTIDNEITDHITEKTIQHSTLTSLAEVSKQITVIPPTFDNLTLLVTHLVSATESVPLVSTESLPMQRPHLFSLGFYNTVVLEDGLDLIHNNYLNGWVYLWTLQSSRSTQISLMGLYSCLFMLGITLLVANACVFHRLNIVLEKTARYMHREIT